MRLFEALGIPPSVEAPLPAGCQRLLERLRAGVEWLATSHAALCKQEEALATHTAGYEKLRNRFLNALDAWDKLDYMLRFTYPDYKGCIMGLGQVCPDDAPVRCRSCAGMVVTETGEQRYA